MRLTHVKTPASFISLESSPPRLGLHFSSFNIVMQEDQEQVDPEQGFRTTESLHMSEY